MATTSNADARSLASQLQPEDFPLKALSQHLVVAEVEKDTVLKSGIVLPDTHQTEEVVEQGRVMSVAEDCTIGVKPNDLIFYSKFIPQDLRVKVKVGDEETEVKVFVVAQKDVMAVVK